MSGQQATAPPLCASGCGFYGSPATLDMCSVGYRQHCLLNGAAAPSAARPAVVYFAPSTEAKGAAEAVAATAVSSQPEAATKVPANQCATCKKKVGLTGFPCRCGATFCETHRYPEKHACSFDFKGAGREAIARANPLIRGDKLVDKI